MTRSSSRKSSPPSRAPRTRRPAARRRRRDRSDAEIDRRIAQGAAAETFLCVDCHCWSLDPALCACWTRAIFVVD